jgi:CHAD domain-containing protein
MTADGIERELKFHVAAAFVVPYLGGHRLEHVPGDQGTLDAHYWDTADLRLVRRGHSLRHRRRDDGTEDIWTLKLAGGAFGGELQRREVTRPGPAANPPDAIVRALGAVLDGRPLEPVCHLRSNRTRAYLVDRDGARRLSVEDDHVSVIELDEVVATFREIEIELADGGDADDLRHVRRRFRRAGAPRPDPVPKVARALGDLARRPVHEPLLPGASVEELVRYALSDGLERLRANDPAVRLELGPEGVHQARVATRRLRADLRTLRPLLRDDVTEPLRGDLAWIGANLGAVRDLDVLTAEVRDAASELAEPLDVTPLITLIERSAAEQRRALSTSMCEPRYHGVLARLERLAALPPLRDDIDPTPRARSTARHLLLGSWRRLEKTARGIDDRSPPERWHEIRKKAKATRYAGELLAPLLGTDASALATAAKRIQDDLGQSNDATIARDWLREHAVTPAAASAAGRLDAVFAAHGADSRTRWKQRWRDAQKAARRI